MFVTLKYILNCINIDHEINKKPMRWPERKLGQGIKVVWYLEFKLKPTIHSPAEILKI